jgi:hypothetical protein
MLAPLKEAFGPWVCGGSGRGGLLKTRVFWCDNPKTPLISSLKWGINPISILRNPVS